MRPSLLLLALLAAAAPRAAGADLPDPSRLVGMDISAAVGALGAPQQMFTWRGTDAQRDNVVFYYSGSLYLFWYRDRVWQVRFDRRYTGSVLGLTMGMYRDLALSTIAGRPTVVNGSSLYVDIEPSPFPLRVRLVFENDFLTDLYLYRSDF